MASPPMVVFSQASPLLPIPVVQIPLCSQDNQGAILPGLTQDSLTQVGLQEQATPTLHQCLL